MIWVVAIAFGTVIAAGTYLALSRDALRCVIGVAMLGSGVNLLVFASGRLQSHIPAIVPATQTQLTLAANPLPQALVLTAIVISFALLCFSLVLAARIVLERGDADLEELRFAEPHAPEGYKPSVEESQ